ncbi:MAG: hypothetical protein H5T74_09770 [Actinobacteria bacterium]|nr:hypothetical protein [Actinomycetota bacterium]MDI6830548.1 hypothetical protein [Actinomycetota bacterium]
MFSDIDDITINYEEEGVQVVRELDRVVLSRGAWATVIFRYRQWEQTKGDYGPDRFTIRRYRKMNDEYRQQAKFNISSVEQAKRIVEALSAWIADAEAETKGDAGE